MRLEFPQGFLLGVSSASAQIEGGEVGSNWNDWYHRGFIKDGSDPAVADDHWNRWREDCELMASLHLPIARLGIEWARVMPERGKPDEAVITRYRQELAYLKELGIRPLVTLHHFSNPMWFEEAGGFAKRENLEDFLDFARLCVRRFGDLVSDWITINEPNVYATNGYFYGSWPPGRKSFSQTFAVLENLAWCHIRCYTLLHEAREEMGFSDTMVGFANHLRVFDPENPKNPLHRAAAAVSEYLFQGPLPRPCPRESSAGPCTTGGSFPKGNTAIFTVSTTTPAPQSGGLPTESAQTVPAMTWAGRSIPREWSAAPKSWRPCFPGPSG